jgi:hypothetical protein
MPQPAHGPIDVTVVTPTRDRPDLLGRAIISVANQVGVVVEHIVLADACPHLSQPGAAAVLAEEHGIHVEVVMDDGTSSYRPARTARLRNRGVAKARGRYVAHLDDDNELEPDHLATLVGALAAAGPAAVAYSWRQLVMPNGEPADLDGRHPWVRDPDESRRAYADLERMGVLSAGSHIMRDMPLGPEAEPIHLVDMSEMLMSVEIAKSLPFRTWFSAVEQARDLCEDRAFVADALAAGISFIPTGRATLRYRLGGYSNRRTVGGEQT